MAGDASREQLRAGLSELQVSPALVHHQPAVLASRTGWPGGLPRIFMASAAALEYSALSFAISRLWLVSHKFPNGRSWTTPERAPRDGSLLQFRRHGEVI
jgi:hypothetical protein